MENEAESENPKGSYRICRKDTSTGLITNRDTLHGVTVEEAHTAVRDYQEGADLWHRPGRKTYYFVPIFPGVANVSPES